MNKPFLFLLVFVSLFISGHSQNNNLTLSIEDYNNWGWESLVIKNGFIELVIVPEIGGRVLKYAMPDDQQMAINNRNIGETYDPTLSNNGPWGKGWGYGGYKNWPAPQSFWNWPPPSRLAWGAYSYTIEHQSADSIIIYLESEVETVRADGLQQSRRFKVYQNSTLVKVEQYLSNISATPRELSIWDITQTLPQHNSENLNNFSVYFPAQPENINDGDLNIKEIANGIHQFQHTLGSSKAFMNLSDGWCANVDERDVQSYFKLFEIDENANYPDNNSNFEIYTDANHEYIEIEVLSPLQLLNIGETMRYDEIWSAANINGITYNAALAGSVNQKLSINDNGMVSGTFGIFNSGVIKIYFYDNDKNILGSSEPISVEASQKILINETAPEGTKIVEIIAYNSINEVIGLLATSQNFKVGVNKFIQKNNFSVYPTICKIEDLISIKTDNILNSKIQLNLIGLNGQLYPIDFELPQSFKLFTIQLPKVKPGVYFLEIKTTEINNYQKLIIE